MFLRKYDDKKVQSIQNKKHELQEKIKQDNNFDSNDWIISFFIS
jgi:hypothetical protein